MALDVNDLAMLKNLDSKDGFTPYEQMKLQHMQSKRPSGTAIGALATSVGAGVLALGIGAWAASRAQSAKEVAIAKNDGLRDLVQTLAGTVAAERAERIAQGLTVTQTINDTISGQQSASQSQATSVENSAYATAMNQIVSDRLTGRSSLDAQPVCIYSAPQPCACPGCGCGG